LNAFLFGDRIRRKRILSLVFDIQSDADIANLLISIYLSIDKKKPIAQYPIYFLTMEIDGALTFESKIKQAVLDTACPS
jgi:hypothetical protein